MILTTDEIYEFTLAKEKGKTDVTVFLIKEVTCDVSDKIADEATYRDKEGRVRVKMGESNKILAKNCLVGWKNLKNKKGEEIPFSVEMIPKFPPLVREEINNEINRISIPTDDDKKN